VAVCVAGSAGLICDTAEGVWPGVRRAGLPRLSPALTPASGAARRRLDLRTAHASQTSCGLRPPRDCCRDPSAQQPPWCLSLALTPPSPLLRWQRHVRYPLLGVPASAIHALFHDSTPLSRHNDSPTATGGSRWGCLHSRCAWCAPVAGTQRSGDLCRFLVAAQVSLAVRWPLGQMTVKPDAVIGSETAAAHAERSAAG